MWDKKEGIRKLDQTIYSNWDPSCIFLLILSQLMKLAAKTAGVFMTCKGGQDRASAALLSLLDTFPALLDFK